MELVGLLVVLLGAIAGLFMLLSEVTNLVVVDVAGAGCEDAVADPVQSQDCEITGGDQHSYALVAVALLTVVMAVGAGLGDSRPAGVALIVAGIVVLGIALIGDLPVTDDTGQVGPNFDDASADPGTALWLEIAGGLLAVVAGALQLFVRPRATQRTEAG